MLKRCNIKLMNTPTIIAKVVQMSINPKMIHLRSEKVSRRV